MRYVKYGSETVITSDAVANSLLVLTASLATVSSGQVVTVPTVELNGVEVTQVDIVIGLGIHMMSSPCEWGIEEPDFGEAAGWLQLHPDYPRFHSESHSPRGSASAEGWGDDFSGSIDII